jgi:hypothetical protein
MWLDTKCGDVQTNKAYCRQEAVHLHPRGLGLISYSRIHFRWGICTWINVFLGKRISPWSQYRDPRLVGNKATGKSFRVLELSYIFSVGTESRSNQSAFSNSRHISKYAESWTLPRLCSRKSILPRRYLSNSTHLWLWTGKTAYTSVHIVSFKPHPFD